MECYIEVELIYLLTYLVFRYIILSINSCCANYYLSEFVCLSVVICDMYLCIDIDGLIDIKLVSRVSQNGDLF